ncbi:MAG TPA: iron-sulfur cluster assembly scaffold protein [Pirellulales bacterium]|nr:iron-sulfur cluster assembly scaffold protein [Pirellulales bacterium]
MAYPRDEDLYQERILEHFEEPYHRGHCPLATHAHEDDNPLCGDVVGVELQIDCDRVCQAWFHGDGCCISQSAASMLVQAVEGQTIDKIKSMTAADMLALFGARLTPNRQKCCLLGWRVLQAALYSPTTASTDARLPNSLPNERDHDCP